MNAKQEAEKSKIELDISLMRIKEAKAFKLHLDMHGESEASRILGYVLDELEATERKLAMANEENDGLKDVISDFELDEINHKGCVKELERKLAEANKVVDVAKTFVHVFDREGQTIRLNPMDKKFRKALSDYEASKEYISQEGE